MEERYRKPNLIAYRTAQLVAYVFSSVVFKKKMLRNEIKDLDGPFVVIANHQAAYDFANLIGATRRRLSFVISNSFYNSLPITKLLKMLGVIPKQQFQTSIGDMRRIKEVIENGGGLVIYPAGLMCEDGLSTPIPQATYKFLKWLGTDVYAARTSGTYFAQPKWTTGFRPGRTYLDVYKLFSAEELSEISIDEVKKRTDEALLFDAYREQEKLMVRFSGSDNVEGLENVLYMCPNCGNEFTMRVKNKHTLHCTHCGYEEKSDEFNFLKNHKGIGEELRYVSDWSRRIFEKVKDDIRKDRDFLLSARTTIHMLDYKKHRFARVGQGTVRLTKNGFDLRGFIGGERLELHIPTLKIPTLPFKPGKFIELQHGSDIYRCVLEDGRLAMKFINMLKAMHELSFSL